LTEIDRDEVAARLDRRAEEIEARRRSLTTGTDARDSELADYDQHPADQGTETYEQELDETTDLILEEELKRVEEARHALEQGTYGKCVVCGDDIPPERLEAVPETIRCLKHQREFEARL
jgi:RNA polymerase-binding transcription factor DksA